MLENAWLVSVSVVAAPEVALPRYPAMYRLGAPPAAGSETAYSILSRTKNNHLRFMSASTTEKNIVGNVPVLPAPGQVEPLLEIHDADTPGIPATSQWFAMLSVEAPYN